jgi:PEP-CTERM motif
MLASITDGMGDIMVKSSLKSALIAGVATLGAGFAFSAHATVPLSSEFQFVETPGQYKVVNNSDDWYVYGFVVTNPLAGDPYFARTTQTDWNASTCDNGSCFGNMPGFEYFNGDPIADVTNDIGPHSSSDRFFFNAPPASQVLLYITNGNTTTTTGVGVPEPATWATMMLGLGMAGLALRRRRSPAASTAV